MANVVLSPSVAPLVGFGYHTEESGFLHCLLCAGKCGTIYLSVMHWLTDHVDFFTAAIIAPLMSELAAVARGIPGLGCMSTLYTNAWFSVY